MNTQIKLKDLIARLEELRAAHGDEILVNTEGCDCVGPCIGAEYMPEYPAFHTPPTILIQRDV